KQRSLPRPSLELGKLRSEIVFRCRIDLVEADDLRLLGELGAIGLEFLADHPIGLDAIVSCHIDEMQEHGAAFNVPQEPVPKTVALMGPFDQSRNVGKDEAGARRPHHAKLRMESG